LTKIALGAIKAAVCANKTLFAFALYLNGYSTNNETIPGRKNHVRVRVHALYKRTLKSLLNGIYRFKVLRPRLGKQRCMNHCLMFCKIHISVKWLFICITLTHMNRRCSINCLLLTTQRVLKCWWQTLVLHLYLFYWIHLNICTVCSW